MRDNDDDDGIPAYQLIHDYQPASTLRSSDKLLLSVPVGGGGVESF